MDGRLKGDGNMVSRRRIRESLRRVDPFGVEARVRNVLHAEKTQSNLPITYDGHYPMLNCIVCSTTGSLFLVNYYPFRNLLIMALILKGQYHLMQLMQLLLMK